jgi:osmotically-inducible protein OsmY
MAAKLAVDGKTTYPAACNATETLLWDADAGAALDACAAALKAAGVELRADEATRKRVQAAIRTIPSVREVIDETQIAGASSLASRGNDALITSNVKARMLKDPRFSAAQVKVVTEAGVVYLMGLVSHAEAEAASEVARTTSGVQRVVKEFEYLAG